jgi:hypothetical protein
MPGALNEGKVFILIHVVDAFGCEFTDPFREEMGVILDRCMFCIFAAQVNNRFFIGDELPFETHFAAIDVEALDVLAGDIK